mgnify:CR=1 FL=1
MNMIITGLSIEDRHSKSNKRVPDSHLRVRRHPHKIRNKLYY